MSTELQNGTVVEIFPNQCRVRTKDGRSLLCSYRRRQIQKRRVSSDDTSERSLVAVGDHVRVLESGENIGVVEEVLERRNFLSRTSPGRKKKIHVLASNIDVVVIVSSTRSPNFTPNLVDRFLIAAASREITTALCVNKIDLFPGSEPKPWEVYQKIGIPCFETSVKNSTGISNLKTYLHDKVSLFCGLSGVGKTSLLAALLEKNVGRTGEVSESTGLGKHTTTSAVALQAGGSLWIDTPGVREFSLHSVRRETLKSFFPEFKDLSCTNNGCNHYPYEEGCRARDQVRYQSFVQILNSLEE